MFGLSFTEILFLAVLGLIVIGPKQLPEVARTLGKFLTELRRTTNVITDKMKESVIEEPTIQPKSTPTQNSPEKAQEIVQTEIKKPGGSEHV